VTTAGIIGTAISAALVLGIAVALNIIAKKLTPPAPRIAADPSVAPRALASESAADPTELLDWSDDAQDTEDTTDATADAHG
jgi:hypothetical protein